MSPTTAERLGQGLLIAAVVIFASGVFLGFFVTGFIIPSPERWWGPALARVAWQLGGAALLGLCFVVMGKGERAAWIAAAGLSLVGALLCLNPLLDLVRGPVALQGRLDVAIRGGKSIFATIELHTAEGVTVLEPSGYRVNVVEEALSACDGRDDVTIVALRHLDVVLAVECRRE